MENKKFIFIVGVHRSGTSFLHDILREQNEISGIKKNKRLSRNEGQHLQNLIPKDPEFGGSGCFAFHERAHLTENSELLNEYTGVDFYNQWKPYWQNLNSDVFVEKSPPSIIRTRFFQELFPNSYFILIMRHPIINSLATKKFNGNVYNYDVEQLIKHWFKAHEIFFNDKKYLKNYLLITYEQLINEPNYVINNIEKFIDVKFNKKDFNVVNGNLKYFNKVDDSYFKYEEDVYKYGYSMKDLNKYMNFKDLTKL
jgi:hypothetical protein